MSSMQSGVVNSSFDTVLIGPLRACLHKTIHELEFSLLSLFIEVVNKDRFHDTLVEHLPVVLTSAALFSCEEH